MKAQRRSRPVECRFRQERIRVPASAFAIDASSCSGGRAENVRAAAVGDGAATAATALVGSQKRRRRRRCSMRPPGPRQGGREAARRASGPLSIGPGYGPIAEMRACAPIYMYIRQMTNGTGSSERMYTFNFTSGRLIQRKQARMHCTHAPKLVVFLRRRPKRSGWPQMSRARRE
jgi:hypothetical protein